MSALTSSWLGLVLMVACAACGPGSYRDFRSQLTDASCTWAKRCGYVGQLDRAACPVEDLLVIFRDSESYRSAPGAIDVVASIEAGRMRYDSVRAQECLDAIADSPCDEIHAALERGLACNAVIASNTETDRPCWTDRECTGGICVSGPGCAGACGHYASPGAPCMDTDTAPLAFLCDPTIAYCGPAEPGAAPSCRGKRGEGHACAENRECLFGWTCRKSVCTEPIEVGDGEPCGGVDPCANGLYCEPSSLACARQHKRGEPCTDRQGCEDGLACLGLVPVEHNGIPTPVSTPGVCGDWLDLGMKCTSVSADPEASITGCPTISQVCTDGVCAKKVSTAGLGESCASLACRTGLACNAAQKCDYTLAIFGDCSRDRSTLCEPGLVCTGTDKELGTGKGSCLPPDVLACFLPVES